MVVSRGVEDRNSCTGTSYRRYECFSSVGGIGGTEMADELLAGWTSCSRGGTDLTETPNKVRARWPLENTKETGSRG